MKGFGIARCLLTLHGRDGSEYALVELANGDGYATLRDGNVLQQSRFNADELEASVETFARLAGISSALAPGEPRG